VQLVHVHLLEVLDVELAAFDLLVLGIGLGVEGGDVLAGVAGALRLLRGGRRFGRGRGGGPGGVFRGVVVLDVGFALRLVFVLRAFLGLGHWLCASEKGMCKGFWVVSVSVNECSICEMK
jgi:hypothetical protein